MSRVESHDCYGGEVECPDCEGDGERPEERDSFHYASGSHCTVFVRVPCETCRSRGRLDCALCAAEHEEHSDSFADAGARP